MTVDEFKALQPEFQTASADLVAANIAAAELETPESIWGDKRDQGIRWLTAHNLALGPGGMNSRKIAPDRLYKTMYWSRRKELERQVAGGPRVY